MGTKHHSVTAKEVADLAGVSQSTVSMILNNYDNVSFSDDTVQKVIDACNTLGYSGVKRTGNSSEKVILVVLPSCDNLCYARQISAVQNKALEYGYTCLTLNTFRNPHLENSAVQYLKTMPIAGSVFLYQPINLSIINRASALKPCVVVCDRNLDLKIDTIEINSFGLGQLIADHMISMGHKNVFYIATDISSKYVTRTQRLSGIKSAYVKSGFGENAVKVITLESEHITPRGLVDDVTAGLLLANIALEKHEGEATAFIGYNDMICLGIIDAIKKKGYHVPQDYSVIGCDNIHLSETDSVSLTTVEHYPHLRARDAADLLLKKISDSSNHTMDVYTSSVTRVEYEPMIIARNSTRTIKKAR